MTTNMNLSALVGLLRRWLRRRRPARQPQTTRTVYSPGGEGGRGSGTRDGIGRGGGDPAGGPRCPHCGAVGRGGHGGNCPTGVDP